MNSCKQFESQLQELNIFISTRHDFWCSNKDQKFNERHFCSVFDDSAIVCYFMLDLIVSQSTAYCCCGMQVTAVNCCYAFSEALLLASLAACVASTREHNCQ
jgi:hypothetical protein